MSLQMLQTLSAMGIKTYAAKENYKLVKELDTIVVNENNRVVDTPNGGNALKIMVGDKAVYIPLRNGTPINKKEYTVGEFEAPEEFTFMEKIIAKGSKKAFAY